MNTRRTLLLGTAGLCVARAWANANPPAARRPLYLEGEVTVIHWAEPQPHLELRHQGLVLPPDLAKRPVPRQKDPVDVGAMLAQASLPVHSGLWYVALPSLARLSTWNVPRPRIKQVLSLVGYPIEPATGTPAVRAEILFVDGRAYPMRSDPA